MNKNTTAIKFPPHEITHLDSPWRYVGWISNPSSASNIHGKSFEQHCANATRSDHGETRELDMYPWGAVAWMKENE